MAKKKTPLQKIWYFIWEDDSIWSWVVNVVLAFILIKFIVFPGLGFLLDTSHPVVAVVSGSMEHKTTPVCTQPVVNERGIVYCGEYGDQYELCGTIFSNKQSTNFDFFWETCGSFYLDYDINKEKFKDFKMHNGFNTGDIIFLKGRDPDKINVGDVLVFQGNRADPIIHRVIQKKESSGVTFFTTKGDHNRDTHDFEVDIPENRVIGKAWFRIPYLGYIKIWFVDILNYLGITKLLNNYNIRV